MRRADHGKADKSHLAAQFETRAGGHAFADLVDHCLHVGGGRAIAGLDEIGVLVGHERATDTEAAQTDAIDQLARRQLARDRIDEDRTGILSARLVLAPPPDDLGNLAFRVLHITRRQGELSRDNDLVVGEVRATETQAEGVGHPPPRRPVV